MASTLWRKLRDFEGGYAAGNSPRTDLGKLGRVAVRRLLLYFTDGGVAATNAMILADVASIRIEFDGKPRFELSPTKLKNIFHTYFGTIGGDAATDDGLLNIPFCWEWIEDEANGAISGESLRIGTKDIGSISVIVTMAGSVTNVDKIEAFIEYEAVEEPCGAHVWVRDLSLTYAGTDFHEVPPIPADLNSRLLFATVNSFGSGVFTDFSLRVGSPYVEYYELPKAVNDRKNRAGGRTNVSNYHTLDLLSPTNKLSSSLLLGSSQAGGPKPEVVLRTKWSTAPSTYSLVLATMENWVPN